MPTSKLSRITLPSGGDPYDLRDNEAGHYIGITTTALSDGDTTSTITIGGSSVTVRANDVVLLSSDNSTMIFNGTSWVSMKPDTAPPNDATITIQKNGTTIADFTLNQSSDETINIQESVKDVQIKGTSIVSSNIANITAIDADVITAGTLANGMSATTQNTDDSSQKLATTAFVHNVVDNLPEPMVFKGTLGASTETPPPTITALPVDGSAKVGDTYKVVTDGTYAGMSAKVGDTFTCISKTSSSNTWVLIPSGDEPGGTVVSVGVDANSGLHTSNAENLPITYSGTIGLNLKPTSAFSSAVGNADASAPLYPVGVDSVGNLAVPVTGVTFDPTSDPYDPSTNPAATVDTVDDKVADAISDLDGGTIGTPSTSKTLVSLSETDGQISASFDDISITTGQVSDIEENTASVRGFADSSVSSVVSSITSQSPSAATVTGEIIYWEVSGETLVLKKLVQTTTNTSTTSNLLQKTTS